MNSPHYSDPEWDRPALTQGKLPFADREGIQSGLSTLTLDELLRTHGVTGLVRRSEWRDRADQVACLAELLGTPGNIAFEAPTGSGKTNVGLLAALSHVHRANDRARVLLIAPHVDLLPQHAWTTHRFFTIASEEIAQTSGTVLSARQRAQIYASSQLRVLCITPETLLNDLSAGIPSLRMEQFGAAIFDECHHARGQHALSLLIDKVVREFPAIKCIGLSATFAETIDDREFLRKKLGNARYVYGAMTAGEKVRHGYLSVPSPRIVRAAQELELGMMKSVDFLREALFSFPTIERDIGKLHQSVRGLVLTPSYPTFEDMRKRIRDVVPQGWERIEIEAHLWATHSLSRYYEMLLHGGRMRFLDSFGRDRAAALYCKEAKQEGEEAQSESKKGPAPGWIFRVAERVRSLAGFWTAVNETIALVGEGAPHSVMQSPPRSLGELERLVGCEGEDSKFARSENHRTLRRIGRVFDRMRQEVVHDARWWDHQKLTDFRRAVREVRDRHGGHSKLLVRTALVSDAFFLADICEHQLGLRAAAVVSGAHLSTKTRRSRLDAFKNDTLDVLVGTSLLDEGHDLDRATAIILYDPVPSGRTRIQAQGRVGRMNHSGEIIEIVSQAPRELLTYHIGRARERKIYSLHE